jgi:hypothetical protein
MTLQRRESFIGGFEAPETTTELDAVLTRLRLPWTRLWGIVTIGVGFIFRGFRFRTGGHNATIFISIHLRPTLSPLSATPKRAYANGPQFLTNRAFFTKNETLPALK